MEMTSVSHVRLGPHWPTSRGLLPLNFPRGPKRRERVPDEIPDLAVRIGRIRDMPTPENVARFPNPSRAGAERSLVQCRHLLLLAHVAGKRDPGPPRSFSVATLMSLASFAEWVDSGV